MYIAFEHCTHEHFNLVIYSVVLKFIKGITSIVEKTKTMYMSEGRCRNTYKFRWSIALICFYVYPLSFLLLTVIFLMALYSCRILIQNDFLLNAAMIFQLYPPEFKIQSLYFDRISAGHVEFHKYADECDSTKVICI